MLLVCLLLICKKTALLPTLTRISKQVTFFISGFCSGGLVG